MRELRTTLRSLSRAPLLAGVAILTLGLGIGANAAIFSVVRSTLLAPLSYPAPERLVRVWPEMPSSTELYEHLRERVPSFSAISAFAPTSFALSGDGRPEEISGARVTAEHFEVLGVAPALGRGFRPEESAPGSPDVAILSHALWESRFGAAPDVLGREVDLDGRPHTVVGVMPADFRPLGESWRIWVPMEIDRSDEAHWDWIFQRLIARLSPGTEPERAAAEAREALVAYGDEVRPGYFKEMLDRPLSVVPIGEHLVGDVRPTLLLLCGAVGLVLLVACANVANLLLARTASRQRELALRGALGAGRRRLLGLVLQESLLLSACGGAVGVLVAEWAAGALAGQLPPSLAGADRVSVDGAVVAFSLGLSALAGVGFGLLPALRALRVDLRTALGGGRGSSAPRGGASQGIVAAETALAAVLVLSAALLVKSFDALQRVDLGFAAEDLITLELAPAGVRHPDDAARRRYFEAVAERAEAVPGVASAAVMARAPMTPGDTRLTFQLPGDDPDTRRSVSVRAASPAFLDALGVPLLAGRGFTASDRAGAPPVGLVNAALARELWGEQDPLGRRLVFEDGSLWFSVVGVVGNTRHSRLDEPFPPQAYLPLAQASWEKRMTLLARLRVEPEGALPALREAVWSVDPDVPISRVASMDALVGRSLGEARLLTLLFTLFGGLALVLGMVGVFGVTSYAVSRRLRESGIRLALGATAGDVVRGVLARAMAPVVTGLGVGCLAFWWAGRLLQGHLFEVQPGDPAVLVAVIALLGVGALAAAWPPARRATRADPAAVLKAE